MRNLEVTSLLLHLSPLPRQSPFNAKHSFPSTQNPRHTGRKCVSLAARRKSPICSQVSPPWCGPCLQPAGLPPGCPSHDKLDRPSRQYVIVSGSRCEGGQMTSAPKRGGRARHQAASESRVESSLESRGRRRASPPTACVPCRPTSPAAGSLVTGMWHGAGPEKTAGSIWAGDRETPPRVCFSSLGELPGREPLSSSGRSAIPVHSEPEPECDYPRLPLLKTKTALPSPLTSPESLPSGTAKLLERAACSCRLHQGPLNC